MASPRSSFRKILATRGPLGCLRSCNRINLGSSYPRPHSEVKDSLKHTKRSNLKVINRNWCHGCPSLAKMPKARRRQGKGCCAQIPKSKTLSPDTFDKTFEAWPTMAQWPHTAESNYNGGCEGFSGAQHQFPLSLIPNLLFRCRYSQEKDSHTVYSAARCCTHALLVEAEAGCFEHFS